MVHGSQRVSVSGWSFDNTMISSTLIKLCRYPNELEKKELSKQTGLSMSQVSTWFINTRNRKKEELISFWQDANKLANGWNDKKPKENSEKCKSHLWISINNENASLLFSIDLHIQWNLHALIPPFPFSCFLNHLFHWLLTNQELLAILNEFVWWDFKI